MPDMQTFLENNSAFGKTILVAGIALSLGGLVMIASFMIRAGMPFFMLLFVAIPFLLMGALCFITLRKSIQSFPQWWDSLTAVQQSEYTRDYSFAQKVDGFLILGERYAYIHHIGRPIAYTDIEDIYFRRSRSSITMFVELRSGGKLVTGVPVFTNHHAVADLLMQRSRQF